MRGLIAAVLLVSSFEVAAERCAGVDPEALQWLDRMSHSLREVSYHGVFTYEHGQSMQALRISHSVGAGAESERVTDLSGGQSMVVRAQHPLDCVHPGHKLLRLNAGFDAEHGDCGLGEFYRLRMVGEDRIAGRDAVLIQISARDMYRYGYKMALDRQTGLLLKSQTLTQDKRILERFQFADLTIGTVDQPGTHVAPVHHAAHPGHAEAQNEPTAAPRSGIGGWSLGWVPGGFVHADAMPNAPYERTYTDGLAVFSVFVEPAAADMPPGEGRARVGGTSAYTRGRILSGQSLLITVVGEVPVNAARVVADHIVMETADVN